MPKEKIKITEKFFRSLWRSLAEHAFLVFLCLTAISLLLGAGLFYKYLVLVKRAEPEITEKPILFSEKDYVSVLKIWQEKNDRFEAVGSKTYPDPFKERLPKK
ncbi:MAG: hypothetical protein V1705_02625 [bacterium]